MKGLQRDDERGREGGRVFALALSHTRTLMPLSFSCSSLVVKGGAVPDEDLSCMVIPPLLPATAAGTLLLLLLLLLLLPTAASTLCCCCCLYPLLQAGRTNALVVVVVDAATARKAATSKGRGMVWALSVAYVYV